LTARPAFAGETIMEKLSPRLTSDPPWVRSVRPEISPGLEEVLRKMMARRPEDRYQTPLEVAQALEPFATPVTGAPQAKVVMAMPVAPDAIAANVVIAHPVGASAPATAPTPTTEEEPEFLGMTATGRDMSSPSTAAKPATPSAKRGFPLKLVVGLVGGVLMLSLLSCACVVGFFFFKDHKPQKTGTLRITKTKWSTGDEQLIPGRHHHVLVWIERVDFQGPVTIWVKDLPPGVESTPLTLPPKVDSGQVKVTVSFGTEPITKAVRVYAECEEAGASAEMPMTLVVKKDPLKK
jgi:hypothetical protein